jgi:hypothetical protein
VSHHLYPFLPLAPQPPMNKLNNPRPKRVTFLAILALIIAIFNSIRIGESIFFWRILIEYEGQFLYTLLSGAVWLLSGFFLVWGLWTGKSWAWGAALGLFTAYPAWYWLDRMLVQRPHTNWLFSLFLTVIFLCVVLLILYSRRTRRYLR